MGVLATGVAAGGTRATRLWALALLALAGAPALAVEHAALEAAIVYNILLFIQWPDEAAAARASLVLCLDGASPLYEPARALEGRPVRGMTLSVRSLDGGPNRCQAYVVDTGASQRAAAAGGSAAGSATLVIEASSFDRVEAPTIQIVEAGGRLAFDVSQHRAREAGLVVSSRLLRLARRVIE